jgi:glycosyltransferase involved in cell wall biosynthesis
MRLVRVAVNAEQLLYRSPGGVGRYTAQLLTVLPSLFAEDEVVPFVARHRGPTVARVFRRAGVDPLTAGRTVMLGWPRPILYRGWLGYQGWLGAGWPKLPVLHGAEVVHAPSVAVPPHPGVPLVVTVHDAAPDLFPESFPPRGRRFHRQGMAAAARRADLVLTVSEAAAAEIAAHSTIPSARIRVVPNGVAAVAVDPAVRHGVLAGRGLDGRAYVLWVGSLEPRKGVGTLVAAMARLRRRAAPRVGDVQLVLAGYPGWLNRDLLPADDAAALGPAIRQLGPVNDDELWSLYAGATVFAFPSRHEGFGLPVLEAMSQGTAVLASDIPAIREVAGAAARLVPPDNVEAWADALEDLLGDEAARDRLAAAGRERARRFDLTASISAIRAVYQELVGR